jgi:glycine/D-amino acid oxidase-like deaminating enzyme
MKAGGHTDYDFLVIGGGFYGCCLALFLRSISDRVLLVEAGEALMTRASRVNQARVHTGFHYPRSAVTAVKSMLLHQRFCRDFPEAVVDDFQMLYGIARRRSKVTAKKFHRMFSDLGAPIRPALPAQQALFDPAMIEEAFACHEVAFDWSVLAKAMAARLSAACLEVRLATRVEALEDRADGVIARLSDGSEIAAAQAFNVTYSQVNTILSTAQLPQARIKHEIAEIALVKPPYELDGIGITVMDGPFFSCMPYPSAGLYSLTHVRYTPHEAWTDDPAARDPYAHFARLQPETRHAYMLRDAQRYLPCLAHARYERSIYDVKTILLKNEADDGRPILYHRKPETSRVVSVLGGKIDNIYDLFEAVKDTGPRFAGLNSRFLFGQPASRAA